MKKKIVLMTLIALIANLFIGCAQPQYPTNDEETQIEIVTEEELPKIPNEYKLGNWTEPQLPKITREE